MTVPPVPPSPSPSSSGVCIYLMRTAAPVATADSPLSEKGHRRANVAGLLAAGEGAVIERMLVAPNEAARATGRCLASALGFAGEVEDFKSLLPGAQPQVPVRAIVSSGNVAVVADEPELGRIAAMLVGRPGFAPFEHGHLVCIERGAPAWIARPELERVELVPFE